VGAGFEHRERGAAAKNVLFGAAGAGNSDGADHGYAIDDRNGAGFGQYPAAVRND
jgi:hypothetical protein